MNSGVVFKYVFKYGVVVLAWRMKRGRLAARGCGRKVVLHTVSASVSPLLKLWTTPASTEPSPRVEPKHPTRGEGSQLDWRIVAGVSKRERW